MGNGRHLDNQRSDECADLGLQHLLFRLHIDTGKVGSDEQLKVGVRVFDLRPERTLY